MFSLTKWQAKVGEYVLCLVLCFVAYNWVGDRAVTQYKTEQIVLQAKADKEQQDKYNKVASELEALKLTRASNATTIKKETERIIERPVYLSVCIDSDGLSVINAAISGSGIAKPVAAMRETKTP